MISTITVSGANRAMLAATWCNTNLDESSWSLDFDTTIFTGEQYRFTFTDQKSATEFALRWR
jgi:hypothetical protein